MVLTKVVGQAYQTVPIKGPYLHVTLKWSRVMSVGNTIALCRCKI